MRVVTYIGCYTDAKQQAIQILACDTNTGALEAIRAITGFENATYQTLNSAGTRLYSTLGLPQFGARVHNGAIAAFDVQGTTLELLNFKHLKVTPPCHVRLDHQEEHLLFAEYTNALAGSIKLTPHGAFEEVPPHTLQHTGHHTGEGYDPKRQDKAHAHYITMTPDNQNICIVDLGLDQLKLYRPQAQAPGLLAQEELTFNTPPGAGPRHLLFHPNGSLAFVVHELNNTVATLRYAAGRFSYLSTLSTLPASFRGSSTAAALKFTPDGKRICVSNRGHDSLVTYDFDPQSGALKLCAFSELAGAAPRDFEFVPGGKFAVVAHEQSHHIMSYAYDQTQGVFTALHNPQTMFRPVCVNFGAEIPA